MMDSTPKRQVKLDQNKVTLNKFSVKLDFTNFMRETFGQWLEKTRRVAGMNQTELATRARVTKATISLYEKDGIDQPRRNQVEKIAKALNVPIAEALEYAGYAPTQQPTKPKTIPELIAALERLGIESPMFYHDLPSDPDGEGFAEIIERIWLDIGLVTARLAKDRNIE